MWERLASVQQLEAKIHDPLARQDPAAERFVSEFWPVEDFWEYFSSQPDLMDPVVMEFHAPDYRYVLIVRGDEFPCGARPWCQLSVLFANHRERARSIKYTWTLDLSLCSEHNVEALRDLMAHILECIQHVLDNGYIVLSGYRVDCGGILGGFSPWLRHVFGLTVWWGVGSPYTYAMWNAACNQWEHTTTVRSWKGHKKFFENVWADSAESYRVRCLWVHPPSSSEGARPVFFNCHVHFALFNFCGQGNHDLRAPLRQEGGTGRAC